MKISNKLIFPSSCHYLPHHPNLEYLQPLFVRQPGRPRFTPICHIRPNYSSVIKRSSEKSFKTVVCRKN